MWCVPLDWLKATVAICLHSSVGKLTETSPGIYYVASTETYALADRRKREKDIAPRNDTPGIFIRCPDKFLSMSTANGHIRYSRLIVAAALKRALTKNEEVHHINSREYDDRPENLMLFGTHEGHLRYQHGHKIEPTWDGSTLTPDELSALSAELSALTAEKAAVREEEKRGEDSRGDEEIRRAKALPPSVIDSLTTLWKKVEKNVAPPVKLDFLISGIWNRFAEVHGLAKILGIEPGSAREKSLMARLRDPKFDFEKVLIAIHEQPFLSGDNDRGWLIYFDWILGPKNLTKVMERSYRKEVRGRARDRQADDPYVGGRRSQ
jgi:hypothetical protein